MHRIMAKLVVALALTAAPVLAQVEKGDVRLGTSFDLSVAEDNTNADFGLQFGYSVTDRVEPGMMLSVVKEEGHDAYGLFGGELIYHLLPASKVVPGFGGAVGRTFGHDDHNANVYEMFFNLDAFATPVWSFNIRTGWERHSEEHHTEDAFILRFGVSVFLKPGHHDKGH